jgi:hypothetical protein
LPSGCKALSLLAWKARVGAACCHDSPVPSKIATGNANGEATRLTGAMRAGRMDFVPQPDEMFYSGDKIYLLYELYNPASYDFNALIASTHTALLRNGIPIRQFNINWRILPNPQEKATVLVGTLDTSHYAPGEYQVVQSVPPKSHMPRGNFSQALRCCRINRNTGRIGVEQQLRCGGRKSKFGHNVEIIPAGRTAFLSASLSA